MRKIINFGISIISVVVIILATINTVVGYQNVQLTKQNNTNIEIDKRELLFQTIVDIVNNKDIQQILLKSQSNRLDLCFSNVNSPKVVNPVLTKNQLKQLYSVGLLFIRLFSKSWMWSILDQYQLSNQKMQKDMIAVIQKDTTLNMEVAQLFNSDCVCDNEQASSWSFPIICSILNVLMIIPLFLFVFGSSLGALGLWLRLIGLIGYVITVVTVPIIYAIINVGAIFDCDWWFIST